MSGSYWLDTVPDLSGHYIPEHASIHGDDPRPEVNEFNRRYKERFGEQPPSSYAYPGYLVIQMWALAAERAGTLETDAVIAELEKFKDEPLLIGSRTFTSDLHHQNYAPYAIIGVEEGKPKYSGSFTISEPVPMDVLLGKRYVHLNP
ncbi:ABC transporter substrate-binding protein [Mesorhizobium sp. ASY16-5R]|uniref:ABC transporter substrate-binding protein n=1 Tax=Mesorhizobium sp. ASY16-5R TaxID=3445772 RepID=UPI003FA0F2F8